jgi:hypothetical protein
MRKNPSDMPSTVPTRSTRSHVRLSGRAGAGGERHAKNPLAQVVDGLYSILAPPHPRY